MNVKVLPWPIFDSKVISPPSLFAILLHMYSPRPLPLTFIFSVDYNNPNSLKSFGLSSSFIPTPLSITSIINLGGLSYKVHTICTLPPIEVNFKALFWRLSTIYYNLCSSVLTRYFSTKPMNYELRLIWLKLAFSYWSSMISLIDFRMSKVEELILKLFDSSWASDNMSLTVRFSSFDDDSRVLVLEIRVLA